MKVLTYLTLILLVSCSSGKKLDQTKDQNKLGLTEQSFREYPKLLYREKLDYYDSNLSTQPFLLEESLQGKNITKENVNNNVNKLAMLCHSGQIKEGLALAQSLYRSYLQHPSFWNILGNCYFYQRQYRSALLYYNKAIELSPNYAPAYNNIGVYLSSTDQWQKALVAFKTAITKSKNAMTPKFNLAKLYLRFNLPQNALSYLQQLENDFPRESEIMGMLANAYYMISDNQKALKYFSLIDNDLLYRPDISLNYSRLLIEVGKKDQAQLILERSVKDYPEYKAYYAKIKNEIGI